MTERDLQQKLLGFIQTEKQAGGEAFMGVSLASLADAMAMDAAALRAQIGALKRVDCIRYAEEDRDGNPVKVTITITGANRLK
ncbi:MAG: hypothetical protein IAF08_10725 [Rhizobacter sp.]|nr:hypothetical protein [Chlorobiales bacterium]